MSSTATSSGTASSSSGTSPTSSSTLTSSSSIMTITPTSTTTSADASSTDSNPPGGQGAPSSSLYLFTFLATLFLLLAISSAIIVRGIFLRRRFRRRLEEAFAAGTLLSPSDDGTGGFGGRTPRRKLTRPTLFDVSVLPPFFSTYAPQDGSWEKLMPFAGNIAAEKPGISPAPGPDAAQGTTPSRRGHRPTTRALLERAGYLIPRARLRRTDPTSQAQGSPQTGAASPLGADASATPAEVPLEPLEPVQRAAEVRVAVVIAMPNPHRTAYMPPSVDAELHMASPGGKGKARGLDGWGEDGEVEEGVPDVVLGVARVPMAGARSPGQSTDGDEREL